MSEEDNPNPSVIQCPSCGSPNIKNVTITQPLGQGMTMSTPAHLCTDCDWMFRVVFYAGHHDYTVDDE